MVKSFTIAARSLAVAVLVAGIGLVAACLPASADPALWVARGPHATVYLFGTIHVLRKNERWESPEIAKALATSQEIWLEVPHLDDAAQTRKITAQLGFDRRHPLSTVLPRKDLMRLDNVARAIGVAQGEKAFEPMRPWLVAVALEAAVIEHAGYDPRDGVEQRLLHDKFARGKPIRGFETFAQQMHFFSDLSVPLEIELLENTMQDFDDGPKELNALVRAWMSGDQAAITRIMVDEVKQPFPALYRTILVDRNRRWAARIAQMLDGSGVKFVAVGAAHLAGPDSVQAALKRRGIAVTRIAETN